MKFEIFKSSNIEIIFSEPETKRFPEDFPHLISYGFKGVWFKNIESSVKSFLLNDLFKF